MANKFHAISEELMPKRATKFSAGYDFFSPCDFVVPAHGQSIMIDSGVSVELDNDKVLFCDVRSSYGFKHNIRLINTIGIVDCDYFPNNIKCILYNDSDKDFFVSEGDRYMQGIILQYFKVDDDSQDAIRDGGIGSTGI